MHFYNHLIYIIFWFESATLASQQCKKSLISCPFNQECIDGFCSCLAPSFMFGGKCLRKRKFGESCDDVFECMKGSQVADPHIGCIGGICQCRPEMTMYLNKCRDQNEIKVIDNDGAHDQNFINNLKNLHNKNYSQHEARQRSGLIGSVGVIILSMILLACCFCFWTMGKSANGNSTTGSSETAGNTETAPNTHHKYEDFDDIELKIGNDNPCFHDENASHYSATTDICEMSHKEIIAKQITMEEIEGEFSLSPSMDENDCEVAIFNAMGTLQRAQESAVMATISAVVDNKKIVRKIELVPDGECTSIESTSIEVERPQSSISTSKSESSVGTTKEQTPRFIDDTDEDEEEKLEEERQVEQVVQVHSSSEQTCCQSPLPPPTNGEMAGYTSDSSSDSTISDTPQSNRSSPEL